MPNHPRLRPRTRFSRVCGQLLDDSARSSTEPTVRGEIERSWRSLGAENGTLGYPVDGEVCGLRDGGCFQRFQGGMMHWSPQTGAYFSRGVIQSFWGAAGWEAGWLGFPTSHEFCGLSGGGCAQHFQGGSVYWSPASGAHSVAGATRDHWGRNGWEWGHLGYPVGEKVCGLRDAGCFTAFQGGSIYWSPRTSSHAVRGEVYATWARQGWETGRLGYPVDDERCAAGTCTQAFQGGTVTGRQ